MHKQHLCLSRNKTLGKGVELPNPFPRLTYAEAMSRYGLDRPDTRFDLELKDFAFAITPYICFLKNLAEIYLFMSCRYLTFSHGLPSRFSLIPWRGREGVIKVLCVPSDAKNERISYQLLSPSAGAVFQ
ncbi:hypothetical protein VNO77_00189 [Canavalia gladiata]|uniref:Aminoacyl-tRNA synthetase class II (D/K/N) domain-containing protein n=1 Tax=Canavalia gladiata TaxID=3824 RepID=A0AAN9R917_CANGL